jgi:DNA invertase Pin-like site-specific DNA recombinase
MKHPIKAAIYCRVATADQLSLDRQEQRVSDYAKAKDYKITSITKEMFKGTTLVRPGIQRLLAEAENGEMDVLLIQSVSRLGRNAIEIVRTFRLFEEFGVEVESVHEGASLGKLLGFAEKLL